jgi:predicted alpha/beta-fold hydrolase
MAEGGPQFRPPFWARSGVVQTLLGMTSFRTWGRNELLQRSRSEVVRLQRGLSLEGHYAAQVGRDARGLAILLSGWEGHAGSPYMVSTGRTLYRNGYEVFRITYPDHGDTQDLNEAVFSLAMLDQIGEAIRRVAGVIRTRPLFVVGFSMGGNLALNLACQGLPGLKAAFAVSPPLDLARSLRTLEQSVFKVGFLLSLKGSLDRKQRFFPRRYDFKDLQESESVGEVAGELLSLGSKVGLEHHAARYALTPAKLRKLSAPAYLVTSVDDPVIGSAPYEELRGIDRLALHVQRHGGHVGFSLGLFRRAWYEDLLLQVLEAHAPQPAVEGLSALPRAGANDPLNATPAPRRASSPAGPV